MDTPERGAMAGLQHCYGRMISS